MKEEKKMVQEITVVTREELNAQFDSARLPRLSRLNPFVAERIRCEAIAAELDEMLDAALAGDPA